MSSCQVCGQGEEGTILDFPARSTSDFYILFLVWTNIRPQKYLE